MGVNVFFRLFFRYYDAPYGCSTNDSWIWYAEYIGDCHCVNTVFALSMILLIAVLVEIGMTLAWGPLSRFPQGAAGGEGNVVIVSPERLQQGSLYPQMQLHQQPILMGHPNQGYRIDEGVQPPTTLPTVRDPSTAASTAFPTTTASSAAGSTEFYSASTVGTNTPPLSKLNRYFFVISTSVLHFLSVVGFIFCPSSPTVCSHVYFGFFLLCPLHLQLLSSLFFLLLSSCLAPANPPPPPPIPFLN